jgi:hypothetical protein
MWPLFLLRAKGKRKEMTGTQQVGTLKHKFLHYIKTKNVLVLFHYQNNFEMNSSSAIWCRHLPVACSNCFEAGVSGNTKVIKNVLTLHGDCMQTIQHNVLKLSAPIFFGLQSQFFFQLIRSWSNVPGLLSNLVGVLRDSSYYIYTS